ncbi:secreted protein [Melampsora americana]|nr:secreted protein [Melampsora americana]
MFSKSLLLVLVGFVALIPVNQAQKPTKGKETTKDIFTGASATCDASFIGTKDIGSCAHGNTLAYCTGCKGSQVFKYCVPLNKGVLPLGWKVPGPNSTGITGRDSLVTCENYANLVRNNAPFGYGCFNKIGEMSYFCGQVVPKSTPVKCDRCRPRTDPWAGKTA